MSSTLRFGICGLGFMGRNHFARVRQHPDAEVVAVCDEDAARRRGDWDDALGNLDLLKTDSRRVSMSGVRGYATPAELVADPHVDAVVIALPTRLHADVTVAALRAGKHVFCEKPMAYQPGECHSMIAAAEEGGRTLMVGQCVRFWPQYELIKRYVDEGGIGRVRFATFRRLGLPPAHSAGNWMLSGELSGGALLDLHVHDVDFAHYLLGVPDQIVARGMRGPSGEIDHVVATYTYADGRYAMLEGGWTLAAPWTFDMEVMVHGDLGTVGWALSRGNGVSFQPRGGGAEQIACEGDALTRELEYFIACVREGRPVDRCTPRSTRTSIILAWLEKRSVETGMPIELTERLRAAWER